MLSKGVVLVTLHKKGDQIIPAFKDLTQFRIVELALDTDAFGTFAGDVERRLPPLENAIAKARLGIKSSGIPRAIASEGSIGPDPQVPFVHSNLEIVVFVDDEAGIVIHESHRSFEITAIAEDLDLDSNLEEVLSRADFPSLGIILKATTGSGILVKKDLSTLDSVKNGVFELSQKAIDGLVRIESDFRAHASPSRQRNIAIAAGLLAKRVASRCPTCQRPGWGRVDYRRGVLCSECHRINTGIASQVINGCDGCGYQEDAEVLRERIAAAQCQYCNP